jgi:hypothetical protein
MEEYLGTISDVSFQVGGASMVVVVAMRKRSIDSEGILFSDPDLAQLSPVLFTQCSLW